MMGHYIYPPYTRRVPNGHFSTAPLHRWHLDESASPHANTGTATSGLAISNSGSVGGGSFNRGVRSIINKGVRSFVSATSDRAVIYTPNPASGDIVTGTALTVMCWMNLSAYNTASSGQIFQKIYNSDLTA